MSGNTNTAYTPNTRAVVLAGYLFASAEIEMEGAAKAAAKALKPYLDAIGDGDQSAIRVDFKLGDFMRRLVKAGDIASDPTLARDFEDAAWERARALYFGNAFGIDADKRKAGKPTRTKAQEKHRASADKAWTRMRQAAGIASSDTRGGKRTAKAGKANTDAADIVSAVVETARTTKPVDVVPLAKSTDALAKALREQGAIMLAIVSRAAGEGVTVPDNVKAVVDAFRRDLDAAIKANK